MLLYFNKRGQLLSYTEYGNMPRVGTTTFQVFAYFDNLDIDAYEAATIAFRRPDLQSSEYPMLFMKKVTIQYDPSLDNNENSMFSPTGGPNHDGQYPGFLFDFGDFTATELVDYNTLLDTPGLWGASIVLFSVRKRNVTGMFKFDVEGSVPSLNPPSDQILLDIVVGNIAQVLATKQDKLTPEQMEAVDSGITAEKVEKLDGIESGAQVNTIESISVNGDELTIDANKNVDITVPTNTSDLTNDGDGTSPFATQEYVEENGGKIDSISVNGVPQTIDANKNVNITILDDLGYLELNSDGSDQGTLTQAQLVEVSKDFCVIRDMRRNLIYLKTEYIVGEACHFLVYKMNGTYINKVQLDVDLSQEHLGDYTISSVSIDYVPSSREINGHQLSSNITLTMSDIDPNDEYAKKEDLSNYVDLTSSQTINATKTFNGIQVFNGVGNDDVSVRVKSPYNDGKVYINFQNTFDTNNVVEGWFGMNSSKLLEWQRQVNGETKISKVLLEEDLNNVAYKNINNNFSTTQTITGSDDTPINLIANDAAKSNVAYYNSLNTRLGNIGVTNNYVPYFWAGGSGTSGQIALVGDIPNVDLTTTVGSEKITVDSDDLTVVTRDTTQTITGTKNFTGSVQVSPSIAGVQLGLDDGADHNANISIVSAGSAAYIDMGTPDVDYGFRIIKWRELNNGLAQLSYANGRAVTIPDVNDTMAVLGDMNMVTTAGQESITIKGSTLNVATTDTQQTISGAKNFTASETNVKKLIVNEEGIEIYDNTTPYIDFHYYNNGADYTARIIETPQGVLDVQGNSPYLTVNGNQVATIGDTSLNTTSGSESISVNNGSSTDSLTLVTRDTTQNITGEKTILDTYIDFKKTGLSNYWSVDLEQYENLNFSRNHASIFKMGTQSFFPASNNARDLGTSDLKWRNLYLIGNLSDGTSSISVANIADKSSVQTVDNKLDVNVHIEGNSNEITYNGDTVTKASPYQNLKTGTTGTRSEVIHLANTTTAGLMSYTDYNQIRSNTARIEQLEGQTRRLLYTASQNPTQNDIATFVDNYLISIGITPSAEEYAGIAVVVAGTYHIWHYYDTAGVGWKDDGLDTVSQFTNSIAGIILGKQADGFVYAENDGTGSVYGWSSLKTRVGNLETGMVSNVAYDTTNKKITKTINGVTSDVVTTATIKSDLGLATVATTGSYNDLSNTPTIPNVSASSTAGSETITIDGTTLNVVTRDTAQTITGEKTFKGGVKIGNSTSTETPQILLDSSDRIAFYFGSNPKVKMGQLDTLFANRITPDSSNTYDIGRSGVYWRDLYLSRNLTDGTNSITIANITNKNDLGAVAFSNDYNDLDNLPDVPSYDLVSSSTTSTGALKYLEDITYTSASASGTDTFVKTINGGSGSFTPTTKYLHQSKTSAVTGVTFNSDSVASEISGGSMIGTRNETSTRRTLSISFTPASISNTKTVLTGVSQLNTNNVVTSISVNDNAATGDITYLESATHTHTGASVGTTASAITGITSGSVTKTTKYATLEEN